MRSRRSSSISRKILSRLLLMFARTSSTGMLAKSCDNRSNSSSKRLSVSRTLDAGAGGQASSNAARVSACRKQTAAVTPRLLTLTASLLSIIQKFSGMVGAYDAWLLFLQRASQKADQPEPGLVLLPESSWCVSAAAACPATHVGSPASALEACTRTLLPGCSLNGLKRSGRRRGWRAAAGWHVVAAAAALCVWLQQAPLGHIIRGPLSKPAHEIGSTTRGEQKSRRAIRCLCCPAPLVAGLRCEGCNSEHGEPENGEISLQHIFDHFFDFLTGVCRPALLTTHQLLPSGWGGQTTLARQAGHEDLCNARFCNMCVGRGEEGGQHMGCHDQKHNQQATYTHTRLRTTTHLDVCAYWILGGGPRAVGLLY